MSELRVESLNMPAAELGEENPLPHLGKCLPHRLQDNFGRTRKNRDFKTVVLENDFLKATFLIELGGRLWSLIHKPTNRELLYVNPVFQPGNLAIRNAWFSGGVEWNVGVYGHTTHTCEPLFVARVAGEDGSPVLRMYEWDRIRLIPYQIDAFLPDDSEFLLVRVRLTNPNADEVPMYWWSNIAVSETPSTRVLVPAEQAYKHNYEGEMQLVPVPYQNDIDQSYAANFNRSADSFYCIDKGKQPWISALDENGKGLVQTSTSRLFGRKMFVWGMNPGGRHWQEFLSVPDLPYLEIQAGLTRIQGEYVQMAGGDEWSWLEAYGMMQADSKLVHGSDWRKAFTAVDQNLKERVSADFLNAKLAETADLADRAPAEMIQLGSGWGALERKRREAKGEQPFCSRGLPFDDNSLTDGQAPWLELLAQGALPHKPPLEFPGAWMVQHEWQELLKNSLKRQEHWLAWLHMGVMHFQNEEFDKAGEAWEQSLRCEPSPWASRNLAVLSKHREDLNASADLLLEASRMATHVSSLALECCHAMLDADRAHEMLDYLEALPPEVSEIGRMRILEARACMALNDLDRVQTILQSRPDVADIREGEVSLSNLWFNMHEKRISEEENIPIDDALQERVKEDFPPPSWLDFRQSS